jgi:hypothetical protein
VDPGVTQDAMERQGYTLISLLFDSQLNWPFVVGNTIASSQLFAYTPALVYTALDIPSPYLFPSFFFLGVS